MKRFFTTLATLALIGAGFAASAQESETPEYGYKQTGFMSTPKVGGYIIGSYTEEEGIFRPYRFSAARSSAFCAAGAVCWAMRSASWASNP